MRRRLIPIKYLAYRPVIAPVVVLLVLLILSLTVGRFLFERVSKAREDLAGERKRNEVLEAKLATLEVLDQQTLDSQVKAALAAVPSSDPTLFALASLRQQAQEKGLSLNNLRLVAKERQDDKLSGAKIVELRFDIQGGLAPTLAFLEDVRQSYPLTRTSKVRFSVTGASSLTNLTLLSFWGELPQEVGKVDDPLNLPTRADEELLGQLGNLKGAQVSQVVPAPPQGRQNPFAF